MAPLSRRRQHIVLAPSQDSPIERLSLSRVEGDPYLGKRTQPRTAPQISHNSFFMDTAFNEMTRMPILTFYEPGSFLPRRVEGRLLSPQLGAPRPIGFDCTARGWDRAGGNRSGTEPHVCHQSVPASYFPGTSLDASMVLSSVFGFSSSFQMAVTERDHRMQHYPLASVRSPGPVTVPLRAVAYPSVESGLGEMLSSGWSSSGF